MHDGYNEGGNTARQQQSSFKSREKIIIIKRAQSTPTVIGIDLMIKIIKMITERFHFKNTAID